MASSVHFPYPVRMRFGRLLQLIGLLIAPIGVFRAVFLSGDLASEYAWLGFGGFFFVIGLWLDSK